MVSVSELCVAALVLSSVPAAWAQDIALDAEVGGTFTSPRFELGSDRKYPNNEHITWVLTAAPGRVVNIEVPFFQVENDPDCSKDYVEFDGIRVCGPNPGLHFVSETNIATVTFHSDNREKRRGFTADYTAIPEGIYPPGLVVTPEATNPPPVEANGAGQTVIPDPVVVVEPTPSLPPPVVVIEEQPTGAVAGCTEESLGACYEKYQDLKISYGTPFPGATTVCGCGDLCSANATCAGFDFNYDVPAYLGSHCWLHATSDNTDLVQPDMNVAHFRKIC